MTAEKLIRRTIYEANCKCGHKDVMEKNPPRARVCKECGAWMEYQPVSAVGPDLGLKGYQ